jgi:hypothetical protein
MNKKQVETKEDIENYYSSNRKFKFKDDYQPESVKDIITKMLSKDSETVFLKGGYHCSRNRRRSMDDIITISKYYFPNFTVKEILNEFRNNLNTEHEGLYKYRTVSYCGVIKKNNFYQSPYKESSNEKLFEEINFRNNGFPNCQIMIKDLINNLK